MKSVNRQLLEKYEEKKGLFKAVVSKKGIATDGSKKRTILLKNCIDLTTKQKVSDHLWIGSKDINYSSKIINGDIIIFEAKSYGYYKEQSRKVLCKNYSFKEIDVIDVKKKEA